MTYDIYRLIFIVGSIACAVMFVVSVILFITLKIPNVIGDLTGRNAKKAIENIRKQNEASGGKAYKASAVNLERGRLTDKMTPQEIYKDVESQVVLGFIQKKSAQ